MLRVESAWIDPNEARRRFAERTVCQLLPRDVATTAYLRECLLAAGLELAECEAGVRRLLLECEAERHDEEAVHDAE